MTKDVFEPVLGAGNDCDPKDIFIGATCDQGRNFINALESMGIPVNVCYAHKNNSVVGWGLGINGCANTCKDEDARKLMNKQRPWSATSAIRLSTTMPSRMCRTTWRSSRKSWNLFAAMTPGTNHVGVDCSPVSFGGSAAGLMLPEW